MRIALIKNGFVVNVIDSLLGAHPDFIEVQSAAANIGDSYDGVVFTAPYVAPASTPPALKWIDSNLDAAYWQIDVGPFKDRFDVYGYAGLKANLLGMSRTNDTIYAAFADMTGRLFIDLKARRNELAAVLSAFASILTSAGKPTITAPMINAILDSYTTDYERHKKAWFNPSSKGSKMKVIYCSNNKIASWLIRVFTWSRFSHVVFVEDEVNIIDSTFTHGGVQRRLLADIYRDYTTIEVIDMHLPDEQAALDFARSQLGKPYDKTAILGFIFKRNWGDEKDWFCSELVEAIIAAGGRVRFREKLSRITPGISWAVV